MLELSSQMFCAHLLTMSLSHEQRAAMADLARAYREEKAQADAERAAVDRLKKDTVGHSGFLDDLKAWKNGATAMGGGAKRGKKKQVKRKPARPQNKPASALPLGTRKTVNGKVYVVRKRWCLASA